MLEPCDLFNHRSAVCFGPTVKKWWQKNSEENHRACTGEHSVLSNNCLSNTFFFLDVFVYVK